VSTKGKARGRLIHLEIDVRMEGSQQGKTYIERLRIGLEGYKKRTGMQITMGGRGRKMIIKKMRKERSLKGEMGQRSIAGLGLEQEGGKES